MKHVHLFLVCMTLAAANFVSGQGLPLPFTYDFNSGGDVAFWSNNAPLDPATTLVGNGYLNTLGIALNTGVFSYGTAPNGTASDMMIRRFGPAVGLTTANWTANVTASFNLGTSINQKASLFLVATSNSGASFSINLFNSNNLLATYGVRDTTNFSGPQAGSPSTLLTLDYNSVSKTLTAKAGATTVDSWVVSSYGVGDINSFTFGLGGLSNAINNDYLTVDYWGNQASFDNFTIDGPGIIAAAPPVPEPSTYAAIMGVAALGVAAIRRRRKSNTAKVV